MAACGEQLSRLAGQAMTAVWGRPDLVPLWLGVQLEARRARVVFPDDGKQIIESTTGNEC
jgi:hypothetical protein